MSEDMFGQFDEKHSPFLFHYYRAEVYRETNWRNRMDITANWAIVSTGALLSYIFSNPLSTHTLVIINYLMVLFFLYTESRRFRYYVLLKQRTRILEEFLLSPMLRGKKSNKKWTEMLADSLEAPRVSMSRLESIAWRIRRNYIFLLPFLFIAWVSKISLSGKLTLGESIVQNASIGIVPGVIVFTVFLSSLLYILVIAYYMPVNSQADDLP